MEAFINSRSVLKEYFLPELSSLGRLTVGTEIMGSAGFFVNKDFVVGALKTHICILTTAHTFLVHCGKQLGLVRQNATFELSQLTNVLRDDTSLFRNRVIIRSNVIWCWCRQASI